MGRYDGVCQTYGFVNEPNIDNSGYVCTFNTRVYLASHASVPIISSHAGSPGCLRGFAIAVFHETPLYGHITAHGALDDAAVSK